MTQDALRWPAEWTHLVGRTVRRRRDQLGLTGVALAELCRELGYEIPRNSIANLENGRKEYLPVHEVVVLARALQVAPIDLLFPLGAQELLRITPREEHTMFEAACWFVGDRELLSGGGLRDHGTFVAATDALWRPGRWVKKDSSLLAKWQWLQEHLENWASYRGRILVVRRELKGSSDLTEGERRETAESARDWTRRAHVYADRFHAHRELMRANGDPLPPLYADAQRIEDARQGIPTDFDEDELLDDFDRLGGRGDL